MVYGTSEQFGASSAIYTNSFLVNPDYIQVKQGQDKSNKGQFMTSGFLIYFK